MKPLPHHVRKRFIDYCQGRRATMDVRDIKELAKRKLMFRHPIQSGVMAYIITLDGWTLAMGEAEADAKTCPCCGKRR